jgi:hypothetical protein
MSAGDIVIVLEAMGFEVEAAHHGYPVDQGSGVISSAEEARAARRNQRSN